MRKIYLTLIIFVPFTYGISQDVNPYKDFGYIPQNQYVMTNKPDGMLLVNTDSNSCIKDILMSLKTAQIFFYDKRDSAFKIIDVPAEDVLKFISVDPLTKKYPMLSPYQFASNSSISGVDLDGLEYYFAANGNYLGQSIHGGTQIKIATQYNTFAKVVNGKSEEYNAIKGYTNVEDYKFDKSNVNTLVNIMHHFSSEANVDLNKLHNKDISVGSLDDVGEGWPVLRNLYNDPGSGVGEIMSSNKESAKLNVTLNNGHLPFQLGDAENVISTLFNEKTHLETKESSVWEHLDVYYKQINHKSWNNTTTDFKAQVITNIRELLAITQAGNSTLSEADNKKIKDEANRWEAAFKQKLGKALNDAKLSY